MKKNYIYKQAFIHALAVFIYICGVSSFFSFMEQFEVADKEFFAPVLVLLLLVTSVALMAALFFVRPIMWYLEGKKKEAVRLFLSIIAFVAIMFVIVVAALVT